MVNVSTLRRASQVFFFIILVWTSWFTVVQINTELLPFIEPNADVPKPEWYNPPADYVQVLDAYGPVKTCRFIGGESRVFRACFLHFISEGLTWGTPINLMIPHILFYIILAVLFGRAFCGWMCPLGFLQEIMAMVRRRLGIPYRELPERVRYFMAHFRYGFITVVLLMAMAIAIPSLGLEYLQAEFSIIGCSTCPARIIMPLFSLNEPGYFSFSSPLYTLFAVIGLSFLTMFFLSFIFNRTFCRICPSGTMLGLFNTGTLLYKEKDCRKCTKCGICARVCPISSKAVYKEKEHSKVDTANCVRCFSCIQHCPEAGVLKLRFFGRDILVSGKKLSWPKIIRKKTNIKKKGKRVSDGKTKKT